MTNLIEYDKPIDVMVEMFNNTIRKAVATAKTEKPSIRKGRKGKSDFFYLVRFEDGSVALVDHERIIAKDLGG